MGSKKGWKAEKTNRPVKLRTKFSEKQTRRTKRNRWRNVTFIVKTNKKRAITDSIMGLVCKPALVSIASNVWNSVWIILKNSRTWPSLDERWSPKWFFRKGGKYQGNNNSKKKGKQNKEGQTKKKQGRRRKQKLVPVGCLSLKKIMRAGSTTVSPLLSLFAWHFLSPVFAH